jgi:hypothetical protein
MGDLGSIIGKSQQDLMRGSYSIVIIKGVPGMWSHICMDSLGGIGSRIEDFMINFEF